MLSVKVDQTQHSLYTDSDYALVLSYAYPVGAIYISTSSTNPATSLGFGTWTRIKDRFLAATGTMGSTKITAGSTGGEINHKLTINEIPAHTHDVYMGPTSNEATGYGLDGQTTYQNNIMVSGGTTSSQTTGGGNAHNNMHPYYTAYIWRRTA